MKLKLLVKNKFSFN